MEKTVKLLPEDCVKVGNFLYFIADKFNIIFKIEITTGDISIVGSLPEEKMFEKRLGSKIVSVGDNLFFAPMRSKDIWKYNLTENKWTKYPLKKIDGFDGEPYIFQAFNFGEKIYFLGSAYPAIIVLDLKTDKVEYVEAPYKDRAALIQRKKDNLFRTDYVLRGNELYRASCLSNEVLKFNIETSEYEYISVGMEGAEYSGIDYDGTYFYLSPRKHNPAIRWDGDSLVEPIRLFEDENNRSNTTGGVVCFEDRIIFYARFNDTSFELYRDSNTDQIKEYKEKYIFYKKIERDLYVSLNAGSQITIESAEKKYSYDLTVNRKEISNYLGREMKTRGEFSSIVQGKKLIKECNMIDLNLFLDLI